MTSRVPGSSPGGSGVFFSLFRQFTSPTDPLNLKFSQSFPNNNNNLNNRRGDNSRKMAINKINCALITTAKMKKVPFHNVFL